MVDPSRTPREPPSEADAELAGAPPRGESGGSTGEEPRPEGSRDEVEEASVESFPASDPPAFTHVTAGPPDRHEATPPAAADRRQAEPTAQDEASPPEAGGRPYTVIFDGNCRTCRRLAEVLQRWDRQDRMWVVPSSDPRIPDLFPWIPGSAYERALQMVGPGRTTVEGAAAIERILDILPGGTPLARLFAIPVMGRFLDRGYRWFARNRRSFGCGDHCTIPLEGPAAR